MEIVLHAQGGLGNQLFQYAYAVLIADEKEDAKIIFDLRAYKKYNRRAFELFNYELINKNVIEQNTKLPDDTLIKMFHVMQGLYYKIAKKRITGLSKVLCRKGYIIGGRSSPLPVSDLPNKVYLYGYFQNAKLLLPIRDELYDIYSFSSDSDNYAEYISKIQQDAIAVSIRCGEDYKNDGWPVCDKSYYLKGIRLLDNSQERQVVVFSDNIEKVKSEDWFTGYKTVFVENMTAIEQLELMKKCKDYVIANSSFSWWGAFLGTTGNTGKVIVPSNWYPSTKTKDTRLILENMTII